jgi:hypothetical protein
MARFCVFYPLFLQFSNMLKKKVYFLHNTISYYTKTHTFFCKKVKYSNTLSYLQNFYLFSCSYRHRARAIGQSPAFLIVPGKLLINQLLFYCRTKFTDNTLSLKMLHNSVRSGKKFSPDPGPRG